MGNAWLRFGFQFGLAFLGLRYIEYLEGKYTFKILMYLIKIFVKTT